MCASTFTHRGLLNMYADTGLGRALRFMVYLLAVLLPLLAWFAVRR
ncbi:MAG TPA: hypothetical protein VL221_02895 [Bacteroidota bacterium]|nr:hypothetical protein [Bacteroidota bacterium]